jgi:phage terminase large subunit
MDLSVLSVPQQKYARAIVSACMSSRLYFVREVLGATPEVWQEEVLSALDTGTRKISIRSGHGVGKTTVCAWLALHFLLFRDDVKVIVTAPSADQMKDGLIPEVNKWIARLPEWMRLSLDVTAERIVRHPNVANNFISFRTARKEKPEALAGVHATHVLIIVDEASGVDEAIYETGQGALSTEGALAVLIGNPTNPSGFFYKTHNSLSDVWWTKRVSCLDSTRVDPSYIMNMARTWGVDSREYRVRVLGEFPESGADAVIPRGFIESAINRYPDPIRGDIVWGLDPGRGGDPTGFVERSANVVYEATELRYDDLMQTVGWVKQRYDMIPVSYRPSSIYIDSIGLGAGVADRLLELGLPVIHVNVSESSSMSARFLNLKAEIWYKMREWFEGRECSVNVPVNLEQLVNELAAVNQKYTSLGKVFIESKEDMKTRLHIKSPNLADALALTFAGDGAIRMGSYTQGWGKEYDPRQYRVPGLV